MKDIYIFYLVCLIVFLLLILLIRNYFSKDKTVKEERDITLLNENLESWNKRIGGLYKIQNYKDTRNEYKISGLCKDSTQSENSRVARLSMEIIKHRDKFISEYYKMKETLNNTPLTQLGNIENHTLINKTSYEDTLIKLSDIETNFIQFLPTSKEIVQKFKDDIFSYNYLHLTEDETQLGEIKSRGFQEIFYVLEGNPKIIQLGNQNINWKLKEGDCFSWDNTMKMKIIGESLILRFQVYRRLKKYDWTNRELHRLYHEKYYQKNLLLS